MQGEAILQQLSVCSSVSTSAVFLAPPTPLQEAGGATKILLWFR